MWIHVDLQDTSQHPPVVLPPMFVEILNPCTRVYVATASFNAQFWVLRGKSDTHGTFPYTSVGCIHQRVSSISRRIRKQQCVGVWGDGAPSVGEGGGVQSSFSLLFSSGVVPCAGADPAEGWLQCRSMGAPSVDFVRHVTRHTCKKLNLPRLSICGQREKWAGVELCCCSQTHSEMKLFTSSRLKHFAAQCSSMPSTVLSHFAKQKKTNKKPHWSNC